MLTTNSPVRRILITVSFTRPSGRRLAANMQSGGSSQNTLKKLNGAALTMPAGAHGVTPPAGRGGTEGVRDLVRSRGCGVGGWACVVGLRGRGGKGGRRF